MSTNRTLDTAITNQLQKLQYLIHKHLQIDVDLTPYTQDDDLQKPKAMASSSVKHSGNIMPKGVGIYMAPMFVYDTNNEQTFFKWIEGMNELLANTFVTQVAENLKEKSEIKDLWNYTKQNNDISFATRAIGVVDLMHFIFSYRHIDIKDKNLNWHQKCIHKVAGFPEIWINEMTQIDYGLFCVTKPEKPTRSLTHGDNVNYQHNQYIFKASKVETDENGKTRKKMLHRKLIWQLLVYPMVERLFFCASDKYNQKSNYDKKLQTCCVQCIKELEYNTLTTFFDTKLKQLFGDHRLVSELSSNNISSMPNSFLKRYLSPLSWICLAEAQKQKACTNIVIYGSTAMKIWRIWFQISKYKSRSMMRYFDVEFEAGTITFNFKNANNASAFRKFANGDIDLKTSESAYKQDWPALKQICKKVIKATKLKNLEDYVHDFAGSTCSLFAQIQNSAQKIKLLDVYHNDKTSTSGIPAIPNASDKKNTVLVKFKLNANLPLNGLEFRIPTLDFLQKHYTAVLHAMGNAIFQLEVMQNPAMATQIMYPETLKNKLNSRINSTYNLLKKENKYRRYLFELEKMLRYINEDQLSEQNDFEEDQMAGPLSDEDVQEFSDNDSDESDNDQAQTEPETEPEPEPEPESEPEPDTESETELELEPETEHDPKEKYLELEQYFFETNKQYEYLKTLMEKSSSKNQSIGRLTRLRLALEYNSENIVDNKQHFEDHKTKCLEFSNGLFGPLGVRAIVLREKYITLSEQIANIDKEVQQVIDSIKKRITTMEQELDKELEPLNEQHVLITFKIAENNDNIDEMMNVLETLSIAEKENDKQRYKLKEAIRNNMLVSRQYKNELGKLQDELKKLMSTYGRSHPKLWGVFNEISIEIHQIDKKLAHIAGKIDPK